MVSKIPRRSTAANSGGWGRYTPRPMAPEPKDPAATYGGSLVTPWLAFASLAGLTFGGFLVFQNSAAGIPWTSPAVFCGGAVFLYLLFATAAIMIAAALRLTAGARIGFLQSARFHAALAAFVMGSFAFYAIARELRYESSVRWFCGIGGGAFFSLLSVLLTARAFASGAFRILAGIGFITVLAGAAALYSVQPRATAAAADPRDFLPKFDPVASKPSRAGSGGRLLVLGIDGITWNRIDCRIAKGELPNFAKLKSGGATSWLRTIEPTASPTIWTTVATGHTPNDHGIRDFVIRRSRFLPAISQQLENRALRALFSQANLYSAIPVTSNIRQVKAIWNIATEMNIPTLVTGWWASYPAEPITGWNITSAASPDWAERLLGSTEKMTKQTFGTTWPEDLAPKIEPLRRNVKNLTREEIVQWFPEGAGAFEELQTIDRISSDQPLSIFASSLLRDEFFVDATFSVLKTEKPELVLCYTRLTDDYSHYFWEYSEEQDAHLVARKDLIPRYKNVVDRAYDWADRLVGRFLGQLKENDVLFVLSDHGFERVGPGVYHHNFGPDGIIALYGHNVKKGEIKEKPHILDVAPTLLHILGVPKGGDMPGRVLSEFFDAPREARSIPTWETSRRTRAGLFESNDDAGRLDELRQLGYVGGANEPHSKH